MAEQAGPSPQQVEFLKKSVIGTLLEFALSTSHEMWNYCDHATILEMAKSAAVEAVVGSPTFGLGNLRDKNGIDLVINAALYGGTVNGGPRCMEVEMREKGAIVTVHGCVFKNAMLEFCLMESHIGFEVICQLADPELESLWTHHLTNGDPFCRFAIKNKTTPKTQRILARLSQE